MRIKQVDCRRALTSSGLPEYPWALNPYKGCGGNCAFCYAPSVLHLPRDEWGVTLEVRTNMPNVLARELRRMKERGRQNRSGLWKKEVVGISTVTDPYQAAEKKYGVTRFCLQQLLRYDMPISIITKSALVLRDMDLITRFSEAEVGVTITTLDDRQRRVMEPGASPVEDRFDALKKYADAGVRTYAFLGPYYPTAGGEELEELAGRLADVGVAEAIFDELSLKEGVKESILNRLAPDSPSVDSELKDTAEGMRESFDALFEGNAAAVYRSMYQLLESKCRDVGVPLSHF